MNLSNFEGSRSNLSSGLKRRGVESVGILNPISVEQIAEEQNLD